jgi:hypothetical protein
MTTAGLTAPNDSAFSGRRLSRAKRRGARRVGGTSWVAGDVTRLESHERSVSHSCVRRHGAPVRCNALLGRVGESHVDDERNVIAEENPGFK